MLSGPKPPASGRRAEVTGGRASMRVSSLEFGGGTVDGQVCVCVCAYNIVYVSHLFVGGYVGCCYLNYYEQYCNKQADANILRFCFHFF